MRLCSLCKFSRHSQYTTKRMSAKASRYGYNPADAKIAKGKGSGEQAAILAVRLAIDWRLLPGYSFPLASSEATLHMTRMMCLATSSLSLSVG